MNLPAEAMEMEAPIRIHRVALRKDPGGAGTFRGGLGVVREYEILDGEVSLSHRGERHFFSAPGLDGGSEGAKAHSVIRRVPAAARMSSRRRWSRRSTRATVSSSRPRAVADMAIRTGGPPEHVREDVRNGKVSEEAARSVYGQARQHRPTA